MGIKPGTERRARARELAQQYIALGDPTGWFEELYREAEKGETEVPWADTQPNPNLISFWEKHPFPADGKTALVIGSGWGDDAEQLSKWGFKTTAFDVSASAIGTARRRFPDSSVKYAVADLLHPPEDWARQFDFVFEAYTLQVLPNSVRSAAIDRVADLVGEGGHLLVIARGRDETDPEGRMPWPLTRRELDRIATSGMEQVVFEDFDDSESPPVRRFLALYRR